MKSNNSSFELTGADTLTAYTDSVIRSTDVPKSNLSEFSESIDIGGEVRLSYLLDVENYVGAIENQNDFRVKERNDRFQITVYRNRPTCEKGTCHATADSKFDGVWLCEEHLSSYAAQYIG
jgi:hypothetical protein